MFSFGIPHLPLVTMIDEMNRRDGCDGCEGGDGCEGCEGCDGCDGEILDSAPPYALYNSLLVPSYTKVGLVKGGRIPSCLRKAEQDQGNKKGRREVKSLAAKSWTPSIAVRR